MENSAETSRLRGLVDKTMDFETAANAAEQDLAMAEEHKLGVPAGTGNTDYLPDGRFVDADSILSQPHVLVEDPGVMFEDHP